MIFLRYPCLSAVLRSWGHTIRPLRRKVGAPTDPRRLSCPNPLGHASRQNLQSRQSLQSLLNERLGLAFGPLRRNLYKQR